ncbi:MAG: TatD DNase family protein [Bermanella sp.]|jgi:TatD DNase family protein|uniref:TatD family hydrolase n=1 Tax=Glaciecola sp. 33A TaxID=2057807 RepID=UPI000C333B84|nr:TatD family hydrolase [Glaciecola sp. 33A]PKI00631.1 hydrolase TatD [Glaciecola sp. 33A]
MHWFDIGVNLLDRRFCAADVIARAAEQSVDQLCVISSNLEETLAAQAFVQNHNDRVGFQQLVYTAGVHPHHADGFSADIVIQLNQLASDNNMVAIGECGLDFNRNFSTQENQLSAFEAQLVCAAQCNKTIYLHERDAFEQQIRLLKEYLPSIPNAIVHCFTGSTRQMEAYLELGCYIGITGWVCDDNRGIDLQEAIKYLPLDRLLLETDAPYLFPKNVKPRAKNNEPCFLPHVANKVADLKGIDVELLSEVSLENTYKAFGLAVI